MLYIECVAGRGALVRRLQVQMCCSVLQCVAVCCSMFKLVAACCSVSWSALYGVAMVSRLLKNVVLFCRVYFFKRALLQKRPMFLGSLLIVATP